MPSLKFNLYYALPVYSTMENGPEFPFNEGEEVIMQMEFGSPIIVTQDRQMELDLRGINARLESRLLPDGEEINDHILSEVKHIRDETRSYLLRFPYGLESVLQVVIADEDSEVDFPFEAGQIIIVPLVVKHVKRCPPGLSSDNLWQALLSPLGDEVNGLIVTNVELAEE